MVDRKVRRRIGLGALLGLLPRRVAEIGTGAERLALRREHRRADLDIAIEFFPRIRDLVDAREIEEVQWRPSDFDGADMPDFFDADVRVCAHGNSSIDLN